MPARFNVSNALCAAGICLAFGLTSAEIASGLSSFRGVSGRLEHIDLGQPFAVVIDFAHAAGALGNALAELRPHVQGRLLLVFGSTGRADHDRPGMGRAAAEGADWFVITSDDPVREDPAAIAREVAAGAAGRSEGRDYEIELDRRAAIRRALALAQPGDVVLLAGKGHERSMLTAAGKEPWDERAEAEAALRELGHGAAGSADAWAAPDHAHDLDLVAGPQRRGREAGPFQDLPVDLHGDRPRFDPDLLQVAEQRRLGLELNLAPVDLQLDHAYILIAAQPAAPARMTRSVRASSTPPIASTGTGRAARTTARSASRPTARASGCDGVDQMGPKSR